MLTNTFDPRMNELISPDAHLEPISVGHKATEGIAWHDKGNYLIFSDMGVGKIYKWNPENYETSVIKYPSNISNGNFIDPQGRIVTCEHATSCVTRMESDGRYMTVLASHYNGRQLNSPNDIIIDSKGRFWFTDPMYGRTSPVAGIERKSELGFQGVYCLDTNGTLILAAKDFEQPNGLCLELDEKTILINDTPRKHIRRFNIEEDCTLSGGEVVCDVSGPGVGLPDGLKIDAYNNIYCTGPGGVHVFTKSGQKLGVIILPEKCRNFCFGGEDLSEMYFACDAIYRVKTNTHGVRYF